MQITLSKKFTTASARRAKDFLAAGGHDISHAAALTLVSRVLGFNSVNAMLSKASADVDCYDTVRRFSWHGTNYEVRTAFPPEIEALIDARFTDPFEEIEDYQVERQPATGEAEDDIEDFLGQWASYVDEDRLRADLIKAGALSMTPPAAGALVRMDNAPDAHVAIADVPAQQPAAPYGIWRVLTQYDDEFYIAHDGDGWVTCLEGDLTSLPPDVYEAMLDL